MTTFRAMQQFGLELPVVSAASGHLLVIWLQRGDPKVQMCDEIPVGVLDIAQDMCAVRVSGGFYGASSFDALNAEFRSLDELSKESSGFAHDEDYRR